MPPKAKPKAKVKAKGKEKKEEKKEEEEPTEYDNMSLEMLRETIPSLRQELDKARLDRNCTQLERDTANSFYEILKRNVSDFELAIEAKEREMELMEENHLVELRVYMQKVKHLEYEHRHNLKNADAQAKMLRQEQDDSHTERSKALKLQKLSLKVEVEDKEEADIETIMQLRNQNEKNIQKMRQGFDANLVELRSRCAGRLGQLEQDLELRRNVDMHAIEERKNQHIHDLMANHEKVFKQMKTYYNDITNDNLKLIKSLKDEIANMKRKAVENQRRTYSVSLENKRLSEPLTKAQKDVAMLQAQLRDRDKDRMSLRSSKARLVILDGLHTDLQSKQLDMQEECGRTEKERDELYKSFEDSVRRMQEYSDVRNSALEQKLVSMEQNLQEMSSQAQEVAASAKLERVDVEQITSSLDQELVGKNRIVRELQYLVTKAAKTYNDSLRAYTAKLLNFGVPAEEVDGLGFGEMEIATSRAPAQLVGA